ncbi:MAG: hypothetical protein LBB67_02975 [Oscillospiraceae bacterium]|nr:hypothetical protein [Oscillospiraceae bacterium]
MKKRTIALLLCVFLLVGTSAVYAGSNADDPAQTISQGNLSGVNPAQSVSGQAHTVSGQAQTVSGQAQTDMTRRQSSQPITTQTAASVSTRLTSSSASSIFTRTKWEVDVTGIVPPVGTTLTRAWRINQGGIKAEALRLLVGKEREVRGTSGSVVSAKVQPAMTLVQIECRPDQIHSQSAQQLMGTEGGAYVENMAKKAGALIALSGAYFSELGTDKLSFTVPAPMVREGKVVATGAAEDLSLNIYDNGDWRYETINAGNVGGAIARGLNFNEVDMMVPLLDGVVTWKWHDVGDEPYVFLARVDSTHYLIAVGEFLSRDTMLSILIDCGAKTAVELNGGNSAYLYMQGVGNAVHPNAATATLRNLNKLKLMDHEQHYMLGIFNGYGQGGPENAIDFIYFK